MITNNIARRWLSWLARPRSSLRPQRRRPDTAPLTRGEILPTACFGTVGESQRLALEAAVAGRQRPPVGAPVESPDHHDAG